jgi:uncharacterized protein YdaU (DUF1376 family)
MIILQRSSKAGFHFYIFFYREEKEKLEKEKKELKKQREREKKEQLRKEGKLLTAKQRADKARAEQMLASMRAQGIDVSLIFNWTHSL